LRLARRLAGSFAYFQTQYEDREGGGERERLGK
jgi:hypothetical protein